MADRIDDLAYKFWSIHPKELDVLLKDLPIMPKSYPGGMRAWFFACEMRKLDNGLIHCPEGVELDLVMYLTSDSTGVSTKLALRGFPVITRFLDVADPKALAKEYHLTNMADDWRMMTRAEIRAYKETQDED